MPPLWDQHAQNAFVSAFWSGIFQLTSLTIVAAFATLIYRRLRARYTLRDELIDGINQVATTLYKPRKLYQDIIDQACDPLAHLENSTHREARRLETIYRCLEEVVAATGQFRALQVKIIPLYGHNLEIFAYYMAIWRYLKKIREKMGKSETLYFPNETPNSPDAFYYLLDAFRYRVMLASFTPSPPGLAKPSKQILDEMRRRGEQVYAEYFPEGSTNPAPAPVTASS